MQDSFGQSPQGTLDETSSGPGVPWSLVLLMIWCAIEGTVFAFALRPTMSELLSDLVGVTINPTLLVVLLAVFLTIIVAGSFACIQVLKDAIAAKRIGEIINMTLVQLSVAVFQILFLYGNLIDDTAPWLAQQGLVLGRVATLGLAFCAWLGVRGMTWYLFGRPGARALIAVLNRPSSMQRPGTD